MKLRAYQISDLTDCLDIYRENLKQETIPDGYEDEFVATLGEPRILSLVLEGPNGVVACGSVHYEENYGHANLSFGLVHPAEQRNGYGSILLVGRIGLVVEADGESVITLVATENSVGFYGEVVGFGEYARDIDEHGNQFFWLHLPLSRYLLEQSQKAVQKAGVEVSSGLEIPIRGEQAVPSKSDRAGG